MRRNYAAKWISTLLSLLLLFGASSWTVSAQEEDLCVPLEAPAGYGDQQEEEPSSAPTVGVNAIADAVGDDEKTQEILRRTAALAQLSLPSDIYATQPSWSGGYYAPGQLRDSYLAVAREHVSFIRYIAGLPAVELSAPLSENAQYGATLMQATGLFQHEIPLSAKPANMSSDFFTKGNAALGSSNLGVGHSDVVRFNYSCLNDSSASNIARMGHRGWLLAGRLKYIGFGRTGSYSVSKVFDTSGPALVAGRTISWPSEGVFPLNLLDDTYSDYNIGWTLHLQSGDYTGVESAGVTLTRRRDGTVWRFGSAGSGEFYVSGGYGGYQQLIFRPDKNTLGDYRAGDIFDVRVTGLVRRSTGQAATIAYAVTVIDTVLTERVELNTTVLSLLPGQIGMLMARKVPEQSLEKITWTSSNPAVATVDDNGMVSAVKAGTTVIRATSLNGKTVSCTVTVQPVTPTGVTVSPRAVSVPALDSTTLTAAVFPANATDPTVQWSTSDASVATVQDGVVYAWNEGVATITARTANGKTDSCTVTVTPMVPLSVTMVPRTFVLAKDAAVRLTHSVYPSGAANKSVTWYSGNPAVAPVDQYGNVYGLSPGTAVITVRTWNGREDTCVVTVLPALPTSVTLDAEELTLEIGTLCTLFAAFTPANCDDRSLTFTSSDTSVAVVSEAGGRIHALKAGKATITATTVNGLTAKCELTIVAPLVLPESVSLSQRTMTLTQLTFGKLSAAVFPSNATDNSVTWTSSDSRIAAVGQDGTIAALSTGTVVITAESWNGKTDSCTVTIAAPVVPSLVSVSPSGLTLEMGKTTLLYATVLPANAQDKSVTWSSSSTSIATVSQTGVITGVKPGAATITARTWNGKTASCTVTVYEDKYVSVRIGYTKAIDNGVRTTVDDAGTAPLKISGKAMLPIRSVSTRMGAKVTYVNDATPITVVYEGITVSFLLGSTTMKVTENNKTTTSAMDIAAQKVGGKTFIPLRAIGQALGFNVYYDNDTEIVVISNPAPGSAVLQARLNEAKAYIK